MITFNLDSHISLHASTKHLWLYSSVHQRRKAPAASQGSDSFKARWIFGNILTVRKESFDTRRLCVTPYDDPYGITVDSSSSCLCPLLPVPPLSPPPPAGLSLATVCVRHAQCQVPRGDRQNALPRRHVSRDCGHARNANGETHKHRRPLRTSFRRLISKGGTKARPAALAAMSPRITWLLRTN